MSGIEEQLRAFSIFADKLLISHYGDKHVQKLVYDMKSLIAYVQLTDLTIPISERSVRLPVDLAKRLCNLVYYEASELGNEVEDDASDCDGSCAGWLVGTDYDNPRELTEPCVYCKRQKRYEAFLKADTELGALNATFMLLDSAYEVGKSIESE